jgi:hypothetical protein
MWLYLRAMAGLLLGASAFACATAGAVTQSRTRSITVIPRVGIGPVRLNEKQGSVTESLGKGRLVRHGEYAGYYAYRSGSITILVGYSGGRADGINTTSRSALIYGRPLGQGLEKLKPVLLAHRWTIVSCGGETFTMLGQGGPGTGIAWRAGRLDNVQIDPGGSIGDQCMPV